MAYTLVRQPDGTYLPVAPGNLIQQVISTIIPGLLTPSVPAVPISESIPSPATTTGSLSLDQAWNLLNPSIANDFTLAPLPTQLVELAHNFPKLQTVFTNLGVKTIGDLDRLRGTSFTLPTIADLKTLPPEVMVAQDVSGKIGVTSSITILDTGSVQQQIQTIANTNLTLAVKPTAPASSVTGYLIFRKSAAKTVAELPFGSQAAAAILATQQNSVVTATIE